MKILVQLSMVCLFIPICSRATPEALETARATVKEWAATEKAISLEAAEWNGQEQLLRDLIEVAQQRIDRLEAELQKNAASLSAADEARTELLDREEAVGVEAGRIEDFLVDLEAQLKALRPRLPEPLEETLAPLYQRIASDPDTNALGLGERMRTVVSLLSQIRQFDGRLTLTESLRTLPGSGETASVRTLYIGLGQAYYLAPEDAGYGAPGPEGWVWQSEPQIQKAVREVLVLTEGGAMEPRFIDLPVALADADGGAE